MINTKLNKTLSLPKAVALAVTMVVGSGLLIIPGLAYEKSGSSAIYAWVICSIATIPLLYVFAVLGSHFPNAGGIAGYMRNIFSNRAGNATEVLFLATLPGGAALALTGGSYLSRLLTNSDSMIIPCTISIIVIGALSNGSGARLSGRLQQLLAVLILLTLTIVSIISLIYGNKGSGAGVASPSDMFTSLPSVGLVFFAFVGWELMSFTSEEFLNPKRDFPRMIYFSFIIVVSLYLLIGFTIQMVLSPNSQGLTTAPIASMIAIVWGPLSERIVTAIGSIIAITNYFSIVWAFSRFAFASAREGLLPKYFVVQSKSNGVPKRAVYGISAVFGLMAILSLLRIVSLSYLFELAGISFFFSYCLCIAAWIKYTNKRTTFLIGVLMIILELSLYATFGIKALYPILFCVLGYLVPVKKHDQ